VLAGFPTRSRKVVGADRVSQQVVEAVEETSHATNDEEGVSSSGGERRKKQ
jgi:hypothetical protein